MAESDLLILTTSMVRPSAPTNPTDFLYLSPLDTMWKYMQYNRYLLFYHVPASEYASFVDSLKQSLSEALLHFYPWAGRLVAQGHEDGSTQLALHCNDLGVELVEASIDLRFGEAEGEDGLFQMRPFFNALTQHHQPSPEQVYDLPLLSIQITRLLGEGMVLGVAYSHVIADGMSLWHFMNSWAECGRGINPISMPPLHDRTVFKVTPSPEIARRFSLRIGLDEELEEETEREQPKGECKAMARRVLHFSGEMIKKLKERSFEEGGKTMRYTSFESLCAHLWRHVTKARQLDEHTRVCLRVPVNFRSRLAKPLPGSYFGNAVACVIPSARAGEVLREDFSATARRVHDAVVQCTEDRLWEWIHSLELDEKAFVAEFMRALKGGRLGMSSYPRFKAYEVDFGWGKPKAVRPARVMADGEMVTIPGVDEGSVDVCMCLTHESMDRLVNDPDFFVCA